MTARYQRVIPRLRYQTGVLTTFTGVLVLVLLTLMMVFALRVGVFEQRVSSSEMRQKLAFHAAESGIHHAKEFFRANSAYVASAQSNLVPDTRVDKVAGEWPVWFHGWLSPDDPRWLPCAPDGTPVYTDDPTHPCRADSAAMEPDCDPAVETCVMRRDHMYFYTTDVDAPTDSTAWPVPLGTAGLLPGTTEEVEVYALLCILDVVEDAETPVQGCVGPDDTPVGVGDGTYFMMNLAARGQADCDGTDCTAEALVTELVSNFGAGAGGRSPKVPLTTKSSFPPSGTAEVVPNPNSGGVGVPVSVWMNQNPDCSVDGSTIDPSSGSWATCEYHEWYGTDLMPEDYACPGSCSCEENESISYTKSTNDVLGIDLVADSDFPCDLFHFYFGVTRANYELVKGYSKIINDCSTLGPESFGIYWVTGAECRINSNTQVGTPDAPIMLISAATQTRMNGGAKLYGTLFVTDVEDANAELLSNGTNTVYGSVIVDGELGSYQGTFQVVWNDNVSRKAGSGGGLGTVAGGWSDFPRDWTFD
jgi:hypothetical protein